MSPKERKTFIVKPQIVPELQKLSGRFLRMERAPIQVSTQSSVFINKEGGVSKPALIPNITPTHGIIIPNDDPKHKSIATSLLGPSSLSTNITDYTKYIQLVYGDYRTVDHVIHIDLTSSYTLLQNVWHPGAVLVFTIFSSGLQLGDLDHIVISGSGVSGASELYNETIDDLTMGKNSLLVYKATQSGSSVPTDIVITLKDSSNNDIDVTSWFVLIHASLNDAITTCLLVASDKKQYLDDGHDTEFSDHGFLTLTSAYSTRELMHIITGINIASENPYSDLPQGIGPSSTNASLPNYVGEESYAVIDTSTVENSDVYDTYLEGVKTSTVDPDDSDLWVGEIPLLWVTPFRGQAFGQVSDLIESKIINFVKLTGERQQLTPGNINGDDRKFAITDQWAAMGVSLRFNIPTEITYYGSSDREETSSFEEGDVVLLYIASLDIGGTYVPTIIEPLDGLDFELVLTQTFGYSRISLFISIATKNNTFYNSSIPIKFGDFKPQAQYRMNGLSLKNVNALKEFSSASGSGLISTIDVPFTDLDYLDLAVVFYQRNLDTSIIGQNQASQLGNDIIDNNWISIRTPFDFEIEGIWVETRKISDLIGNQTNPIFENINFAGLNSVNWGIVFTRFYISSFEKSKEGDDWEYPFIVDSYPYSKTIEKIDWIQYTAQMAQEFWWAFWERDAWFRVSVNDGDSYTATLTNPDDEFNPPPLGLFKATGEETTSRTLELVDLYYSGTVDFIADGNLYYIGIGTIGLDEIGLKLEIVKN